MGGKLPKFVHIEYGFPQIVDKLPEETPTRLGLMRKFWEQEHAFSSDYEYAYRVNDPPTFSWIQVMMARLVYNPRQPINGEWIQVGPFRKEALIEYVRRGLEIDDDIIQQWFDADDVVRLLDSADSFEDILVAADAICGGHEVNRTTLSYVERALGESWRGDA